MGDGAQPIDGLGTHASRIDHAGWILVLGVPQDEWRINTTLRNLKMYWDNQNKARLTIDHPDSLNEAVCSDCYWLRPRGRAAIQGAKAGKGVAVIEKRSAIGGVCINAGTIPNKAMREAVLHLSGFYSKKFLWCQSYGG
jgi:hypothetical protein